MVYSKLNRRIAKILIFVLTVTTVFFGMPPGTASAAPLQYDLFEVPESQPGGLKITWYDAKRTSSSLGSLIGQNIDRDLSKNAFLQQDRSVVVKTESISDLSFDTNDWAALGTAAAGARDVMTWGEVQGYIKLYTMSFNCDFCPALNRGINYELEIDGKNAGSNWTAKPGIIPDNEKDSYVAHFPSNNDGYTVYAFRLRVGRGMEGEAQYSDFNLKYGYNGKYYDYPPGPWDMTDIPSYMLYSTLALQDMRKFFQLDPKNYTLYLDPEMHKSFPAGDYVYGVCGGVPAATDIKDSKTLQLGTNELEQTDGNVFVMSKRNPSDYIVIDSLSATAPCGLEIVERTPNAATLTWYPPVGGMPVIDFDIYRKEILYTEEIASFEMRTVSMDGNFVKVGSTKELSFVDRGIRQDTVYEYTVAANYQLIPQKFSRHAYTYLMPIKDLPGTPTNLRLEKIIQGEKNDLVLRWDETPPLDRPMVYNIYRKLIKAPAPADEQNSEGGVVIMGPLEGPPVLIGRSDTTEYIDRGLEYRDSCEYYVQASSAKGYVSFISDPLNVTVSVMAPTAPGNLKIGNVQRSGEDVKYDFPDKSDIANVLMGPRREVVLQWDPSKDNSKVVGYNIYRNGWGKDLKTDEYWEESEHLIANTTDDVFIDSGLKLGGYYTYTVEAVDDEDNRTKSRTAGISTMQSALSALTIKSGAKNLTPSPAFAYYNTDYMLDVTNEVEAIRLIPQKADSLSEVVINGIGVDGGIDLALDPGENIIPIEVRQSSVTQETMNYTLTVNRANLEDLPALKLTDLGAAVKEGESYKASGSIELQENRDWKGTVDYGDGTGIQPLRTDHDGSFVLEHQYQDNGKYQIEAVFRYLDKGMVKASLEAAVVNVAPAATGLKDEYTVKEGDLLKISGTVVDPGRDDWLVTGYADGLEPQIRTEVMADKTFSLAAAVYDKRPEYDMRLQVTDDDGGTWSKNVKLKVENVAPVVQLKGVPMVQAGTDYIGAGSFTDPGQDSWQATVDYGDGSGIHPLNLKADKTFDLKHIYKVLGDFTITVRVEDSDGASGSVTLPVKVKLVVTSLEMGENVSMNEGDTMKRDVPVFGSLQNVKEIRLDYGDGSGGTTVWTNPGTPGAITKPVVSGRRAGIVAAGPPVIIPGGGLPILNIILQQEVKKTPEIAPDAQNGTESTRTKTPDASTEPAAPSTVQSATLSLEHTYKDNGTYTVKAKIVYKDGDVYEDSFNVEVANVAPTVQLSGGTIFAGDTFTCSGMVADPGDDAWTVEISSNYGFQPQKINLGSGRTFSFDRIYNKTGIYEITATAKDDDGGVGSGSCQLTINRHPSTRLSDSASSDATIHSLSLTGDLTQNQSPYTSTGFRSECLDYTITGGSLARPLKVFVDDSAAIRYRTSLTWASWTNLVSGNQVMIDLGEGHTLEIEVTAGDGVTTNTYTIVCPL